MKLIGISGKIGSGKTFLANELIKLRPEYQIKGFGDILKEEMSERFGIPLNLFYDAKDSKHHFVFPGVDDVITLREALQKYGTDYRRAQDPYYWIKAFDKWFQSYKVPTIAPDVRFLNEAKLMFRGGYIIRLDTYDGWEPGPFADHVSETELDNYRYWDVRAKPEYGELPELALQIVHSGLL